MQEDSEYQISLSALYGDGAQSEAVAVRYSTSESRVHRLGVRLRLRLRLWLSLGSGLGVGLWLEQLRFHTQQPNPGEHLLHILFSQFLWSYREKNMWDNGDEIVKPVLLVCLSAVSGGGPSAVQVSDETPVSLRVSWTPPNAHVLKYRVSYAELSETERQDRTVSRPGGSGRDAARRMSSTRLRGVLVSAGVCPRW